MRLSWEGIPDSRYTLSLTGLLKARQFPLCAILFNEPRSGARRISVVPRGAPSLLFAWLAGWDTDEDAKEMRRTTKVNKGGGLRPRLGTQLRGEMATAYAARGNGSADLALHYSPKAKKDVALSGQLQFLNFLYCEIDSDVKTANYAPFSSIARLAGEDFASLVDVEITTNDGRLVWRRLVHSEPDSTKFVEGLRSSVGRGALANVSAFEVWTYGQLTTNPVRLRSALRAVSWMAGARYWPLAQFKRAVLALIENRRTVTFEDVLSLEQGSRRALAGAAVLEMACTGTVRSDFAEVPLHALTLFQRIGDRKC